MALKGRIKVKLPSFKLRRPKVPSWSEVKPKLTPWLLWRMAVAGLALLVVLLLVLVWTSGARDTRQAFLDGRRIIVRIDTGDIEGKQISLQKTPMLPNTMTQTGESSIAAASQPPAMPDNKLAEKSADGPLPVVASDGTKPWRYYAKPFNRTGSLPVIAIVITGLGESKAATEAAIQLPQTMTLSFSPYSRDLGTWTAAARAGGHEMMMDLPMQPANYPVVDPGPEALMAAGGNAVNLKHMNWLMSRFAGYTGFVTPQNETFTSNGDAFKPVLTTLSNHGLMLLMGSEPAKADTRKLIETSNVANATADTLIDEDLSPGAIQARLSSLEQQARDRGYAIGVAQAYPLTMEQLAAWSKKLNADGVSLVPLSFIVKLRFS